MRQFFYRAGLGMALVGLAALAWADQEACRRHGGVGGCGAEGQTVCKDGTWDTRFTCTQVSSSKEVKQVLKFKKRPNHGQILKPGEHPPAETLEQSQKEMKER